MAAGSWYTGKCTGCELFGQVTDLPELPDRPQDTLCAVCLGELREMAKLKKEGGKL